MKVKEKINRLMSLSLAVALIISFITPKIALAEDQKLQVTINPLVTNEKMPTLTGTVNDSDADLSLRVNGSTYPATAQVDGSWDSQITESLDDGQYGAVVTAIDGINTATADAILTIDTVSPTLKEVSISSSNKNPNWAKIGDSVKVSFTASEDIKETYPNLITKINGTEVTPVPTSKDGLSFEFSKLMDSTDPEGLISFSVDFEDLAGNVAETVEEATDKSWVKFDITAPEFDAGKN